MLDKPIIFKDEATAMLNAGPCTVRLSIALGDKETIPPIKENLIYIQNLGLTHIHNISSIKVKKKFIDVEWSV